MKTWFFLGFCFLGVVCCGVEPPVVDIRGELAASFRRYASAKMESAGVVIDSVMVLEVDSLTERGRVLFELGQMAGSVQAMQAEASLLQSKFELEAQKALLNKDLFGKDNTLTTMARDDAQKSRLEAKAKADEALGLLARMDSLNGLVEAGRFDSVIFLGYQAKLAIRVVDLKSGAVNELPGAFFMFDPKFRVIETSWK